MGELWICREQKARIPFRLEIPGVEIFTLEELCFYLYHNLAEVEEELMGEKLSAWLEEELGMPGLARGLDGFRKQGKEPFWCAWYVLHEAGMYDPSELDTVREFCRSMEQKNEFERQKLRADHLVRKGQYARGIEEYGRILQASRERELPGDFLGDVWHNLGVAHGRLFLFAEAQKYFERAFERNHRQESQEAAREAERLASEEKTEELEQPEKAAWQDGQWKSYLENLQEEYKKKVM